MTRGIWLPAIFTRRVAMQAPSGSLGQVTDSKVVAEGQKSRKKKARKDLRLVRFGAADGSVILGLVPPSRMLPDGSVKGWEFNKCYRIKDVDKVGRLSVVREVRGDEEDLPPDLQRFEQVEEVEDDPRIPAAPVMSIENLRKWYPLKRGFFETVFSREEMNVKAVDDVSFSLSKGEIFALAGASGSPSVRKMGEREVEERVKKMLSEVELVPPEEFMYRFPHEMSGGQRQRVAVARAFVLSPSFVVADEPVSMLDVSIRAEIINLMVDLVRKSQASILFISHDIALAIHIADCIAVHYSGKMMELETAERVVDLPLHPYTQALISAAPVPDPESKRARDVISGEIPSPVDPPSGCRFQTRSPYAHERCVNEQPSLVEVEKEHYVACHLYT